MSATSNTTLLCRVCMCMHVPVAHNSHPMQTAVDPCRHPLNGIKQHHTSTCHCVVCQAEIARGQDGRAATASSGQQNAKLSTNLSTHAAALNPLPLLLLDPCRWLHYHHTALLCWKSRCQVLASDPYLRCHAWAAGRSQCAYNLCMPALVYLHFTIAIDTASAQQVAVCTCFRHCFPFLKALWRQHCLTLPLQTLSANYACTAMLHYKSATTTSCRCPCNRAGTSMLAGRCRRRKKLLEQAAWSREFSAGILCSV